MSQEDQVAVLRWPFSCRAKAMDRLWSRWVKHIVSLIKNPTVDFWQFKAHQSLRANY